MSLPLNTINPSTDPVDIARYHMVEQQIRPWNVQEPEILALLSSMHREDFVPAAYRSMAFTDMEIPLREGVQIEGQCMLAPRVEARTLHDLHIQPHETVLEVGTGSGFMAALLARRARSVLSLEIEPALADIARSNLAAAGIHNAEVRVADGARDAAAPGTFDVIVLSGSVATVPPALLEQIKPSGRLFAVVGSGPMMRATIITRKDSGLETSQPWDTVVPRLQNFAELPHFQF